MRGGSRRGQVQTWGRCWESRARRDERGISGSAEPSIGTSAGAARRSACATSGGGINGMEIGAEMAGLKPRAG